VQLASVASPGEVGFNSPEFAPDLQVNSFARLGRITLLGQALVDASGDGGGTVLIRSGHLLVDGSYIFADNLGALEGIGVGVDLRVTADAVIRNESSITTDRFSTGRAKDLQVTAGSIHMDNSGLGSSGRGAGNGGNVLVNVGTLTLTGGAQIATVTSNTGNGGELTIRATDGISISGRGTLLRPSGLFTNTFGDGDAGRLRLSAPTLSMMEEGLIQAAAAPDSSGKAGSTEVRVGQLTLTGGAQISTSSFGTGSGGEVSIAATESISIAGRDREGNSSGLFSTTGQGGRGGNLQVTAPQFRISDGGTISAQSMGAGDAGDIMIHVGQTFQSQHGTITTTAAQATGGNIQITAASLVRLQDSQLTATVGGGTGNGGNVTIDPEFILLQGSQITANAVLGNGGRLSLTASKALLQDSSSVITATSLEGLQGEVNLQAPVTSLSGAVAPLPQLFAQTAELLQSRCVARLREGTVSRLVLGGRDGVPLEPGSLLLSPLQRVDQERGVQTGQRQPQHPAPQHGVSFAQAETHERWEGECARWRGQSGTPEAPKRRR
jgi:large exoprotein involved in heme utilization and adhesion